jgi:hypothetical protein
MRRPDGYNRRQATAGDHDRRIGLKQRIALKTKARPLLSPSWRLRHHWLLLLNHVNSRRAGKIVGTDPLSTRTEMLEVCPSIRSLEFGWGVTPLPSGNCTAAGEPLVVISSPRLTAKLRDGAEMPATSTGAELIT